MSRALIDIAALMRQVGDAGHGGTAVLVHEGDGSVHGPCPSTDDAVTAAAAMHGAVCAVAWRAGAVPVGEAAFAVAAAAPHRAEAFAACRLVAAALAGA